MIFIRKLGKLYYIYMSYKVKPLSISNVSSIFDIYTKTISLWHFLLYTIIITADILHSICHRSIYRQLAFMFSAETLRVLPFSNMKSVHVIKSCVVPLVAYHVIHVKLTFAVSSPITYSLEIWLCNDRTTVTQINDRSVVKILFR